MSNPQRIVVWNEGDAEGSKSFVGYLQVFGDKSATKLKNNAIVAYPVHFVLMNFSAKHRL